MAKYYEFLNEDDKTIYVNIEHITSMKEYYVGFNSNIKTTIKTSNNDIFFSKKKLYKLLEELEKLSEPKIDF